jgi:hypothetical protein
MDNLHQYAHKFFVRNSKLARNHSLVPFYQKYVDRNRKRVLIACMPKSASSLMSEILRHYLGFPLHGLTRIHAKSDTEISWSRLGAVITSDALFVHQHVRASENTLQVIRLFNIHTVVMIRNLLDSVVSFRDHLNREGLEIPMAYVDDHFLQWESRRQYEFVIDLILPWHLNFLGTWVAASKQRDIALLWLNYSDWIHEPEGAVKQIDAFCGLPHREEAAREAVARARKSGIRFNVGTSGRGRELLDEDLQAKVRHLFSYYPTLEPYRPQLIES